MKIEITRHTNAIGQEVSTAEVSRRWRRDRRYYLRYYGWHDLKTGKSPSLSLTIRLTSAVNVFNLKLDFPDIVEMYKQRDGS